MKGNSFQMGFNETVEQILNRISGFGGRFSLVQLMGDAFDSTPVLFLERIDRIRAGMIGRK